MTSAVTLGRYLRDARVCHGWTAERLSREANIPLAHVEALEAGRLNVLPGGLYRRAEARAYAEALGLDPELIVAAMQRALDGSGTAAVPDSVAPVQDAPTRFVAFDPPSRAPAATSARGAASVAHSSHRGRTWRVAAALILAAAGILWERAGAPTINRDIVTSHGPEEIARRLTEAVHLPTPPRPAPALARALLSPAPATATAPWRRDAFLDNGVLVVQSTPPGARVTVNGVGWGVTPVAVRYLPSGPVRVRLVKDRYLSQERVVQLTAENPRSTLRVVLPPRARPRATPSANASGAMLVVNTVPAGARVTVNGIGWGTTPLTITHLAPGTQRVRVVKEQFQSEERVVRVDEGRPGRVAISLKPAS